MEKSRSIMAQANTTEVGHTYGLFVGVEEFLSPQIPGLAFAADDAYGLWEAFGGESNPDLEYLLDKDGTRENILRKLSRKMAEVSEGDLLIFYIGGHGMVDFEEFFFLPYDHRLENGMSLITGLPASLLINAFSTLAQKGVHVLLLFDTCHSGAIPFDISKYKSSTNTGGLSCIFSCFPMELSHETFFDKEHRQGVKGIGADDSRTGNGVFSYYLIEGLMGAADMEGTGEIRLRALYNYVYKNVRKHLNSKQHPFLTGTLEGELVVRRV